MGSIVQCKGTTDQHQSIYQTREIAFQFHFSLWKTNILITMANVSGGNSFIITSHWVYKLLKAERLERGDQQKIGGEMRDGK